MWSFGSSAGTTFSWWMYSTAASTTGEFRTTLSKMPSVASRQLAESQCRKK